MARETYWVALFKSVSYALMAEKVLKKEGIPFKLIPVPKEISADCGVCLRFTADARETILQVLSGRVEIAHIRPLE
jgi:hypothetical protein